MATQKQNPRSAKKVKTTTSANQERATPLESPRRRSQQANATSAPTPTPKRKRRTRAEIDADNTKKEKDKQEKQALTKKIHRTMLQMDINKDVNREETAARTIRTYSHMEDEESGGEEFVGYDDVSAEADSESDNSVSIVENTKLKQKTKKAPQKRIKALDMGGHGGKKVGVGGKKSAKNVTFASGLRPDSLDRLGGKLDKARQKLRQQHVQILAGGLDDSDTEDINPYMSFASTRPQSSHILTEDEFTMGVRKAKRNFSRQNELITIESTDDEEEYVPHPAKKKIAVPIPRPRVKMETSDKAFVPKKTAVQVPKTKAKTLNGNTVRMSDLPEFAREKWRTIFLPMLYDKFFASEQPFDGFNKGSDHFIALLQNIVDEVYPNVDYEVSAKDGIHFLAYNWINEKRSCIGSNAVAMLKKHLDDLRTRGGDPAEWLCWALRVDGPLFFKDPSPIDSPKDHDDPKYQFPGGRLLSPFIINLAAPLLKLRASSLFNNGYPRGLVALIMAALERAVKYLSKPSLNAKEFSKEFWGAKVSLYYNGFQGRNGVKDARWKELVDLCGDRRSESDDDDMCDADLSVLDNNRALVFNFSSPIKTGI